MPHNSEEKFIPSATERALQAIPHTGRVMLYVILFVLATAYWWAATGVIQEQTNANGKVVPYSHNQMVQSLEGGIIETIAVQKGQLVEPGDLLVTIDATQFLAALEEARVNLQQSQAQFARLNAELKLEKHISFAPSLALPVEIQQREQQLMESRYQQWDSIFKEKQKVLQSLEQELAITKPLVRQGHLSKLELLQLEQRLATSRGQLERHQDEINAEILAKLTQTRQEIASLKERMVGLQDKVDRTKIYANIRAQVKQVFVNSIGGVISPGMEIMELVPLDKQLLIEARVKPQDVGYLYPGQEVLVKVTAYDFSIYGGLQGQLDYISGDTIKTDQGEEYYLIEVITKQNHIATKSQEKLAIIPGMQVTTHILTGEKTVLDYLLKPIKKRLKYGLNGALI